MQELADNVNPALPFGFTPTVEEGEIWDVGVNASHNETPLVAGVYGIHTAPSYKPTTFLVSDTLEIS
jgi:hypothetical protein